MKQKKRNKPKEQKKRSVCKEARAGRAKVSGSCLSLPCIAKSQSRNSPRPVFVNVFQDHNKSPHIIDLRQKDNQNIWDGVHPYAEKPMVKKERKVVDFAKMIQNHRLKTQITLQTKQITDKTYRVKNIKHILNIYFKNIFSIFFQYFSNIFDTFKKKIRCFSINLTFKRFAYSAIIILILAGLPFPAIGYYNNFRQTSAKVAEESTSAFLSLQSSTIAAFQSNLDQAKYDLNEALISFGRADSLVEKDMWLVKYVGKLVPIIGPQVLSRQHLLTAGHHLALGNTYLVKGIETVQVDDDISITERMDILQRYLQSSLPQYKQALEELEKVGAESVPAEYQQSFNDIKLLFAVFIDDLNDLSDLCKSLQAVLGGDQLKRYLLVFQNNYELRPTGGFLGSFAIVDLQKGKVANLTIPSGGSYDLQGQLTVYLKPPLPLQLVNKRWEFQDANWFPDFSASAQKMEWFYQQSSGATVDGVIAINATVLERLLSVLGPMDSVSLGKQVDQKNVLAQLHSQIKLNKEKEENKPKAVLSGLATELLGRLSQLKGVEIIRLLTELNMSLNQKEIQVYFNDPTAEGLFHDFGWTGEIWNVGNRQDYLMVIATNLQGEKSDAKIDQRIEHQAVIDEDGSIIDTVVVSRKHNGSAGDVIYGANNVSYIRLYVPKGAELIDAAGFVYPPEDAFHIPEEWYKDDNDIINYEKESAIHTKTGTRVTEEFGKTVFGNWMMTSPGEESSIYFIYRLPFGIVNSEKSEFTLSQWKNLLSGKSNQQTSHYSIAVQKQSGIDSKFSFRIIYPDDWHPVWESGNKMDLASNGATWETVLDSDKVLGIAMEREK